VSMLPFLGHVEKCKQCRERPRFPCVEGYRLFQEGAERLTQFFEYDPKRPRA
jgi:hypothetical protein